MQRTSRPRRRTLLALAALATAAACAQQQETVGTGEVPSWVRMHPQPATERAGAATARPSGARQALDYWGDQRVYPNRTLPDAAYGAAIQSARSLRAARLKSADTDVPPWQPIGPANVGGRTLCLALHPDDPEVIFAGSASGGLWKTTTGGVGADAWDYVDTGLPVLGVATIAIDPTDGDVMYIGTGEAYSYREAIGGEVVRTTRGSYGIGILKTTDGGASWAPSLDWTYQQSRGVWMVRIDPLDSRVLYAATTEGVFKSTDAGDSWTLVHDKVMAMDVRVHPINPDIVFAAHGNLGSAGSGIYRSTDGGQNWTRLSAGLPISWNGKAQLALSPTSPQTLFASIARSNAGLGLYRSDDLGDTWALVNGTDYALYQGWYSHYVIVSPFDGDALFTGGIEIWRSTDGGSSLVKRSNWQSIFFGTSPAEGPLGGSNYAHADHHFAVWHPEDPNTVFFASDGGVFRTTDLGVTFQSLIGGYQTSQFYNGFSNSAFDPDFAMGGLQDNFTVLYEGTPDWRRAIGGDGSWSAQNPMNGSTLYGSAQNLQIVRSHDAGENWTNVSPPNLVGDATAFVAPFVLSPSNPSVLYAGRSRVYRSDNEGTDWIATGGGIALTNSAPVLSLAVAPSTDAVAYAGTAPLAGRARVFRTTDGGASWDDVTGPLPDRYPSDLTVDPVDPERVVVTLMGFGTSHVFLSNDGGGTWNDIGSGLPDIPTSAVELDPDHPFVIYVGTDLGVYVTLDEGASWQVFTGGMPLAMVNDLKVVPLAGKIRAATHGNGAWERDLFDPDNCAAPGPATGLLVAHTGRVDGETTLTWTAPEDAGAAPVSYDTLSSAAPDGFGAGSAECVESDGADTATVTIGDPDPGGVLHYLVRAESLCGPGPAGNDSSGEPRLVTNCPAL